MVIVVEDVEEGGGEMAGGELDSRARESGGPMLEPGAKESERDVRGGVARFDWRNSRSSSGGDSLCDQSDRERGDQLGQG